MKVTPINKKFGKYAPGDVFDFPDKPAKVFIKIGKLEQVHAAPTYQTRMMTADTPAYMAFDRDLESRTSSVPKEETAAINAAIAPYGYKADGTPRKRPGRPAAE